MTRRPLAELVDQFLRQRAARRRPGSGRTARGPAPRHAAACLHGFAPRAGRSRPGWRRRSRPATARARRRAPRRGPDRGGRGGRSSTRAGPDVEHPLAGRELESRSMSATVRGSELVWPSPIGSGPSYPARARFASGRKASRGERLNAARTASIASAAGPARPAQPSGRRTARTRRRRRWRGSARASTSAGSPRSRAARASAPAPARACGRPVGDAAYDGVVERAAAQRAVALEHDAALAVRSTTSEAS